jgi:hypothetical protein
VPHPLVEQLRFTRQEWQRALDGVSDEDARHRFLPMNCISWMVGHLARHENRCWFVRLQGTSLVPNLDELAGTGRPATTPPLADMWAAWEQVTRAADPLLGQLDEQTMQAPPGTSDAPGAESTGTMTQRMIYHYWFHMGEALALRQMLGQRDLPEFVGDLNRLAPYRPSVHG